MRVKNPVIEGDHILVQNAVLERREIDSSNSVFPVYAVLIGRCLIDFV